MNEMTIDRAIEVLRKDGHEVLEEKDEHERRRVNFFARMETPALMTDEKIEFEARRIQNSPHYFVSHVGGVVKALSRLKSEAIVAAVDVLYDAWKAGKIVMFCGNGGSGASCSHIVNDLQKNVALECGKPLKALCLNDCMPLVSAWANDAAWDAVFYGQMVTWVEPGGVIVAVSGSGNSENVLRCVTAPQSREMKAICLTGFDGGALKERADISIHVPTESMQQAEDVHMVILHMLFLGLVERIKSATA